MTTSPVLWAKRDLNPRLPRYQRGTLTIWVTCPLNTIPISEHPWKLYFCGPEGNRTLHSLLAREKRHPWNMRAQNTHLKYDKFKELCAFGGIEPTHIWPLLIYIVSSCILSLGVKPTCTEQLQSPIYCDKPAFIFVSPLGFEPRTHRLEICCSIQLSYGGICVYGEIRTHIAHPFHLYCRAQCNIQAITHFCGSTSHLLHIYIISQGRRLTPTGFNVLFYNSRDGGTRTLTPCDTRS